MVPTTQLPPIRSFTSASCQDLTKALEYIRNLYQPRVRGSRRRWRRLQRSIGSNTNASTKHETEASERELGHLDPFERNYTTKWLGALISHLESQYFSAPDSPDDTTSTERLIQSAASLVALCSGASAAGTMFRDFTFTSSNHVSSLCSASVRIRDIPLNNQDYSSVGAQTWGGACVLAEMIVVESSKFGFFPCYNRDSVASPPAAAPSAILAPFHPLRVLELGAGTGLVSITTAKVLETLLSRYQGSSAAIDPMSCVDNNISKQNSTALITIVATDYYPPVLDNLAYNIAANFSSTMTDNSNLVSITSHQLDWAHFSATYCYCSPIPSSVFPPVSPSAPFDEPFDVILGADIVYELEHATWIKSCLSILLRKPGNSSRLSLSSVPNIPDCVQGQKAPIDNSANRLLTDSNMNVFHLVIPRRPTHEKESQTIEAVFPYSECFQDGDDDDDDDDVFLLRDRKRVDDDTEIFFDKNTMERELCILSREFITCEKDEGMVTDGHYVDNDDDDGVTYVYYRIGWSSRAIMNKK